MPLLTLVPCPYPCVLSCLFQLFCFSLSSTHFPCYLSLVSLAHCAWLFYPDLWPFFNPISLLSLPLSAVRHITLGSWTRPLSLVKSHFLALIAIICCPLFSAPWPRFFDLFPFSIIHCPSFLLRFPFLIFHCLLSVSYSFCECECLCLLCNACAVWEYV